MKINEFDIALLGPSRVGKTSLLATMYDQLVSNTDGHIQVTPDDDTLETLTEAKRKLSQVTSLPGFTMVPEIMGGDKAISPRIFNVKFKNNPRIKFTCWDVAGGIVTNPKLKDMKARYVQILKKANVIINVLDGTVLMVGGEELSDQYNGHLQIRNMLSQAVNDDQKHCVIFVITKCEKWLREGKVASLKEQFEKYHAPVLNLLVKNDKVKCIALIPVQTLGCVEYSHTKKVTIEEEGEQKESDAFVFVKKGKSGFQPKNVDQPLRCAVWFLMEHVHTRGFWGTIADWLDGFKPELKSFYNSFDQKQLIKPIAKQ